MVTIRKGKRKVILYQLPKNGCKRINLSHGKFKRVFRIRTFIASILCMYKNNNVYHYKDTFIVHKK